MQDEEKQCHSHTLWSLTNGYPALVHTSFFLASFHLCGFIIVSLPPFQMLRPRLSVASLSDSAKEPEGTDPCHPRSQVLYNMGSSTAWDFQ